MDDQWPQVEAIADIIHGDPQIVQAWKVPNYITEMMQLAADRPVEYQAGTEIDPQAAWLIAAVTEPDCPGFSEHSRAGGLKLLARLPQLGARAPTSTPHRSDLH